MQPCCNGCTRMLERGSVNEFQHHPKTPALRSGERCPLQHVVPRVGARRRRGANPGARRHRSTRRSVVRGSGPGRRGPGPVRPPAAADPRRRAVRRTCAGRAALHRRRSWRRTLEFGMDPDRGRDAAGGRRPRRGRAPPAQRQTRQGAADARRRPAAGGGGRRPCDGGRRRAGNDPVAGRSEEDPAARRAARVRGRRQLERTAASAPTRSVPRWCWPVRCRSTRPSIS